MIWSTITARKMHKFLAASSTACQKSSCFATKWSVSWRTNTSRAKVQTEKSISTQTHCRKWSIIFRKCRDRTRRSKTSLELLTMTSSQSNTTDHLLFFNTNKFTIYHSFNTSLQFTFEPIYTLKSFLECPGRIDPGWSSNYGVFRLSHHIPHWLQLNPVLLVAIIRFRIFC